MRIAILSNAPFDAPGGAGQIAGIYAKLLEQHGHEVRAWGPRSAFLGIGAMDPIVRLWFHLNDLQPEEDIAQSIREWRPDVLLTHNLTGCGFGTPKAVGVRWVHVLHDVQLIEPSGQIIEGESFRLLRRPWRWFWSGSRQAAMGEPQAVVSPTTWLLEFHKTYGWFKTSQTEVIPNPIRTFAGPAACDDFSSGSRQGVTAKNVPARHPHVIYVGRLDRDKGVDLLLDAWKKIEEPKKHLTIVGDGSWRPRIADLKDPTIDLRGPLPNAEVRQLFCESDVAVVPSRVWENQPTVILEALAAGCNVVAADVGGIRETLSDAGWIVRPDSLDALVDGVRAALSATHDAAHSDAARKVLARHDPEAAVGRLEGLLRSNL